MIIDTHAHLDFSQFGNKASESLNYEKIEEVIKRAEQAGVKKIINIGCNYQSSKNSVDLSKRFEQLYATLGFHPCDVEEMTDAILEKFKEMAKNEPKVIGIGEVGLDYFHKDVPKEKQIEAFKKQISLARELELPLIVHCRDAYQDTLQVIDEEKPTNLVFHCYSGDLRFAEELWNRGYFTSFTGIITYPNVYELLEVVKECPMDKFMVETDCPFLAPQAYRGKTNEPAYTTEVVRKIAEVKGKGFKEIERLSTENARSFFKVEF